MSMSIQYDESWDILENMYYGDGMVPTRSATLGMINTENVFYQQGVDHNDLVKSSATLELIHRILNHNSTAGINGMEANPYETNTTE